MRGNLSDRFWAKVDKSGECWLWTAARFTNAGYGMFSMEGHRLIGAHRAAWILTNGPIPPGMMVLHSCDNRLCVRPDHLSLGTHRDNMDQMVDRLRHTHGMAHHSSRLTEDDVRVIRRRIAAGDGDKDIASDYGVTPAAIFLIRSGKNWKWLDAA